MKMYKENFGFNNFNKKMMISIFSVCIFFFVAFLSVGFSAFQESLIITNIAAEVQFTDAYARVSNFKVHELNNSAVGSNTDYNYDRIYGNILLPNIDSTVVYEVEVVNLERTKVGIADIIGLDPSLTYTLSDYVLGNPIKDENNQYTLGTTMKFYITIGYAEGAAPIATQQSFNLTLDFRAFHSVVYHGVPGEGHPNEVMDGFDLVIDTELINSERMKITQDTVFLVNGEHFFYDAETQKLTVKNVGGDLLLSYRNTTYLLNLSSDYAYYKDPKYKTYIKKIEFVNHVDISNAEVTYDLSENQDNSIVGWIENLGDGSYDLYIGSVYDIYTKNFSKAFANMTGLDTINFQNLNTSESTSFAYTFYETDITQLDLSTFNTASATTMVDMFAGMDQLETLDVSNFNTSQVTNMWYMFGGLSKITELDISSFDTSSANNMGFMFSGMSSLTKLNLGKNFNTSLVTNMESMFSGLNSIPNIDLSTFKTNSLKNTKNMFYDCDNITNLDLSHFNTENVTTMTAMFYGMNNLRTLNISTFNTSNVEYMNQMFADCPNLSSLDVTSFNTENVTTMQEMFSGMASLVEIDLSSFVLTNTTNMSNFLYNCTSLQKVDFRQADFTKVGSPSDFFNLVPATITVIVKDATAQAWIQEQLGPGKGTVIIYEEPTTGEEETGGTEDTGTGTETETGTDTTT